MSQFLDGEGLKHFSKQSLFKKSGTTQFWEQTPNYIPMLNEIIIYTDYQQTKTPSGIPIDVPGLKVGNGINKVEDLPFINSGSKISQLSHGLRIGEYFFDGSADVTVPVYHGQIE